MKKTLLVLGVWFLVLGLAGCATSSSKGSASVSNLEPSATAKFSDVPVPSGYRIMPEESYIFQAGDMRVGILEYQGKATGDQVVNFYKQQMPMFGWNLLNTFEYGARLLNFEKEHETCLITIDDNKNLITVSVGPKSQVPLKKAARLERPLK